MNKISNQEFDIIMRDLKRREAEINKEINEIKKSRPVIVKKPTKHLSVIKQII